MLKFCKQEMLKLLSGLKPTDTLTLVGDDGVYVMCFAQAPDKRTIVYAKGCDPKKDEDYYENKCALYGGDDGGDDFADVQAMQRIANQATSHVLIKLTPTQIACSHD